MKTAIFSLFLLSYIFLIGSCTWDLGYLTAPVPKELEHIRALNKVRNKVQSKKYLSEDDLSSIAEDFFHFPEDFYDCELEIPSLISALKNINKQFEILKISSKSHQLFMWFLKKIKPEERVGEDPFGLLHFDELVNLADNLSFPKQFVSELVSLLKELLELRKKLRDTCSKWPIAYSKIFHPSEPGKPKIHYAYHSSFDEEYSTFGKKELLFRHWPELEWYRVTRDYSSASKDWSVRLAELSEFTLFAMNQQIEKVLAIVNIILYLFKPENFSDQLKTILESCFLILEAPTVQNRKDYLMLLASIYVSGVAVNLSDSWVQVQGREGFGNLQETYMYQTFSNETRNLNYDDVLEMLIRAIYTPGLPAEQLKSVGDAISSKIANAPTHIRKEFNYEPEFMEIFAKADIRLFALLMGQRMGYIMAQPRLWGAIHPVVKSIGGTFLIRRESIISVLSDDKSLSIMGPMSAFILLTSPQLTIEDRVTLQSDVYKHLVLPANSELFEGEYDQFWGEYAKIPGLSLPQKVALRHSQETDSLYWISEPTRILNHHDPSCFSKKHEFVNIISNLLFANPQGNQSTDRQRFIEYLKKLIDETPIDSLFFIRNNLMNALKAMENLDKVPENEREELRDIVEKLKRKITEYLSDFEARIKHHTSRGNRMHGYAYLLNIFIDIMNLNIRGCFVSSDLMRRFWTFEEEEDIENLQVSCGRFLSTLCDNWAVRPKCLFCHLKNPVLFYKVVVPLIQYARDEERRLNTP